MKELLLIKDVSGPNNGTAFRISSAVIPVCGSLSLDTPSGNQAVTENVPLTIARTAGATVITANPGWAIVAINVTPIGESPLPAYGITFGSDAFNAEFDFGEEAGLYLTTISYTPAASPAVLNIIDLIG